jgi:hypothetical protein
MDADESSADMDRQWTNDMEKQDVQCMATAVVAQNIPLYSKIKHGLVSYIFFLAFSRYGKKQVDKFLHISYHSTTIKHYEEFLTFPRRQKV